jgi:hypothetical protein
MIATSDLSEKVVSYKCSTVSRRGPIGVGTATHDRPSILWDGEA